MKKNYKAIHFFVVLFSIATMKLGAQALSGAYTINQTIAASATNFQSFNAFATAINTNGMSAAVTVDVVPGTGPYNEQVQFNQITGASGVNRITVNGNNNLITFSGSSGQPWTIAFNGTDYFNINNLQVQGTNVTYAFPLKLWNAANYNTMTSCTFSVDINSTGTTACPISISGNGTSYSSASATTGDYNRFVGCLTYGGYAGIAIYRGTGSTPYTQGGNNEIVGCTILDFYYTGIWNYAYENGTKILNNTIQCPTRTNTTTKSGIYCYGAQNTIIDGNKINNLFNASLLASTGTCYGIYCYYNTISSYAGNVYPSPNRNIIRNNVISDINFNGTLYGVQCNYFDGELYNNTISLDHTGATSGTTYGIYTYAFQANYVAFVQNNIVTITRGGSGVKYCYYNGSGSTGTDIVTDRNDFYINSAGGTNYVGFHTTLASNLAALQTQGANQSGYSVDPAYVTMGSDYHFTNTTINNTAILKGLTNDAALALRNPSTPDIGAYESLTPLCTGTPSMTVGGPTYSLCPGETAFFGLTNLSTDNGYTFQWFQSGVSQVGPWNTLTAATSTGVTYSAPNQTTTNWYSCVITCTAAGGASVQSVAQVNIAGVTTSTVTYNEGFENIGLVNRLPNCSWSSPQIGGTTKTYVSSQTGNRLPRTGNSFATFDVSGAGTAGTSYYYTNGIQMVPGITYSASLWYQSDLTGASNWSDLSILIGTSQSPTGLTSIASTGGPAISPVYKLLGNTFQVTTAGLYYVAIRATSNSGSALYLSWDDLKIDIPCTPTLNTPTISLAVGGSTNVCAGSPVNLTASGANAYSWNTGGTTSAITVTPSANSTYVVTGTNSLTGCSTSASQAISVKTAPIVLAFALPPVVCAGKPTNLSAQGQGVASYNWNVGGSTSSIPVSPTVATTYTVIGTAQNGCSGQATVAVGVNALPNVTGTASNANACKDDAITLSGSGATTYNWISSVNSNLMQGVNVVTVPGMTGPVSYTVTGTDNNGCTDTDVINITVNACTGINGVAANSNVINVYPNPNTGVFTVELNNGTTNTVEVLDMTGRIVSSNTSASDKVEININTLASGVYYVRVKSATSMDVIKVVKQ